MKLHTKTILSPVGRLMLVAEDSALIEVCWEDHADTVSEHDTLVRKTNPVIERAEKQLKEYFSGRRKHFEIKFIFRGTEFQKRVWAALETIPYRKTISYGEIARQIGQPSAVRAVGGAIGKNPLPIVVPCHRVLGANGALTGFTGGLERKVYLLGLELNSPADSLLRDRRGLIK